MRSTHSSRLKRFPSRSMRSSYRTSMLVKDGPISSRYLYNIEENRRSHAEVVVGSGRGPKVQGTRRNPPGPSHRIRANDSEGRRLRGIGMNGQHTIGIAGVGKMGEALVRGLLVGHVFPPARIFVSDAIPPRAKEVSAKHGVGFSETVQDLAGRADILVLAAKPKDMASLLGAIGPRVKKDALVITLAAGVRTSFIEKGLARRGGVVRIMPNLACAVGEGATAFALGKTATEHDALTVEEIFGAIGRVTMVEEKMLDAVTGLSGSGPGFIAALAHSMIEGGVRSGLPREVAYKLTLQTMKGTAELLLIDGLEPLQLFRMVATPNGTTEAGWKVMEARGVPSAISDGIVAASARAADLASEVARSHR